MDILQLLSIYSDANVKKVLTAVKRHLCYLSEINISLAFLDERINYLGR